MKRMIAYLTTITICIGMFTYAASAATYKYFSDVPSNSPYYNAVNYLYEHEIIFGTSSTAFSPLEAVTRGQFVTFLWRMLNKPSPSGTIASFSDLNTSASYYQAVRWASSSNIGIVSGYTDGTFLPNKAVTEQEAITFLYRFVCYCGYSTQTSADKTYYKSVLSNSNFINKASFSNFAKPAAGWAIENQILTDVSVVPTENCKRGTTALYLHRTYSQFQCKYGITVGKNDNSDESLRFGDAAFGMFNMLVSKANASATCLEDITETEFYTAMSDMFSDAKRLDICYLYIASHGSTTSLSLFTNGTLTPTELRTEINKYQGTFIVFISGCHSGTFISMNIENEESPMSTNTDFFDADAFLQALIGETSTNSTMSTNDLTGSNNIKVLCSSRGSQLSYSTYYYATWYWTIGCGYNIQTGASTTRHADSNNDQKISLNELYTYSQAMVSQALAEHNLIQEIVAYPQNDNFIIVEYGY